MSVFFYSSNITYVLINFNILFYYIFLMIMYVYFMIIMKPNFFMEKMNMSKIDWSW